MMVRRMGADRERQAVTIHYRHDFHAFSALGRRHFGPAPLSHREGRIDEAFFFVERAFVAKLVGDIRQNAAQHFIVAPSLKAPMHCFVIRIALRQHVPLRAGVQNPQNSFQNPTCRNRLPARPSIGNVLFGKMIPNPIPLLVRQPNHPTFIADRLRPVILR